MKANDPGWNRSNRLVSDAALSGIIQCGHCNCRMTPVKSHRWGRTYNYYHCSKDFKRETSLCPVRQVTASDVENVVCEHLMPILKSPEVVIAVSQQTGIRPRDVMHTFENGFWNELTSVEKQQLMRIMLERVVVNEEDVTIEFRTENIKSIQEANSVPQNP